MTTSESVAKGVLTNSKVQIAAAVAAAIGLVSVSFMYSSEPEQPAAPIAQPLPTPVPQPPATAVATDDGAASVSAQNAVAQNVPPQNALAANDTASAAMSSEAAPPPLDISDAAVKTAIITLSNLPALAEVVVNDELLRRFVVFTNNLADQVLTENHQFLTAPSGQFRIYRQADKEWIDAASYKRYSAYAEALDSIETEQLLALYDTYKPAINDIYAEIGDPREPMDERLLLAIDHVLDTPEIIVPVEVYRDSVMYKYRDQRIENLSAPQKQLLRTGPENMRQIKAKLREIKEQLQQ